MTDATEKVIAGGEVGTLHVPAGSHVRVVNSLGGQVVDAWFFAADEPAEHASMSHSRAVLRTIRPTIGGQLVTRRREPIVTIVADTTEGIHDMTMPSCDRFRYAQLGAPDHANCADNLVAALADLGHHAPDAIPDPFNLFQNSPVSGSGAITFEPSTAGPGSYVELRAERDLAVVLSACPMDIMPINGGRPREVLVQVLSGGGDG